MSTYIITSRAGQYCGQWEAESCAEAMAQMDRAARAATPSTWTDSRAAWREDVREERVAFFVEEKA